MLQISCDDLLRHDCQRDSRPPVKSTKLLQSAPCWLVCNTHLHRLHRLSLTAFQCSSAFNSRKHRKSLSIFLFFSLCVSVSISWMMICKLERACTFILQCFSLSPPSPLCLCPRFLLLFLQLCSSVILSMTSSC